MPFQIIRNDITKVAADAIVNTANPEPLFARGTDYAVYQAAGAEELLAERQKIGRIEPGEAAATPAFRLQARYIIHTVGPEWVDGSHGEQETLRSCYANSLKLAAELGCESIAFPLISTGIYEFPKDEGLNIALEEIGKFLLTHEMEITLVVFDREAVRLSRNLMLGIREFIDERTVDGLSFREYAAHKAPSKSGKSMHSLFDSIFERKSNRKRIDLPEDSKAADGMSRAQEAALQDMAFDSSLEDLLGRKEDSFQERLFKLIDERGLTDPEVYKKANISRKVFSKIRCNPNYRPTKKTAVAFAIALELDLPATKDLLSRAEIAMSPGSKFDLIIEYFITHRNYNIYEINIALFDYGQELLGY